jgi:hypothetical protein
VAYVRVEPGVDQHVATVGLLSDDGQRERVLNQCRDEEAIPSKRQDRTENGHAQGRCWQQVQVENIEGDEGKPDSEREDDEKRDNSVGHRLSLRDRWLESSLETGRGDARKRDDRDRHDDAVGHQELDRARPVPGASRNQQQGREQRDLKQPFY